MTRRELFSLAPVAVTKAPLQVPVHHILDGRARLSRHHTQLWQHIWKEAFDNFASAGIHLKSEPRAGDIRRAPSGQPDFTGLEHGVINLVITDRIPMEWDKARAVSGVTTLFRGYHLCVVALNHAHGHQIPFFSVNTCIHELLHALLQDIFERRPKGFRGETRELQIDAYATRLWLFRDGATIRRSAQTYLERLRSTPSLSALQ